MIEIDLCDVCEQRIHRSYSGKRWSHDKGWFHFHRAKPMRKKTWSSKTFPVEDNPVLGPTELIADSGQDLADGLISLAAAYLAHKQETKQESDDSWAAVGQSESIESTRSTPSIELEAPEPPSSSSPDYDCGSSSDSGSSDSSSCDCGSSDSSDSSSCS